MSESKTTPGPWRALHSISGQLRVIAVGAGPFDRVADIPDSRKCPCDDERAEAELRERARAERNAADAHAAACVAALDGVKCPDAVPDALFLLRKFAAGNGVLSARSMELMSADLIAALDGQR
jgi:hypothetical protein